MLVFYLRKNRSTINNPSCRSIYKGRVDLSYLKGGSGDLWDIKQPPFNVMYQLKVRGVL
jgi:hypothetical protein